MKTIIKATVMGLMLIASHSALSAETTETSTDKILPYPIYQHKMDNGLNVVTVPFDSPGLASLHIITRVGARNEVEPGVTGCAHFFEHMMFRGTDKYSKEEFPA